MSSGTDQLSDKQTVVRSFFIPIMIFGKWYLCCKPLGLYFLFNRVFLVTWVKIENVDNFNIIYSLNSIVISTVTATSTRSCMLFS